VKLRPEQLPDPWLFDSKKLLRELDRCREMVLLIPATTPETHFAANIAIDALWNLRETISFLLELHREGQQAFAKKHNNTLHGNSNSKATTTPADRQKHVWKKNRFSILRPEGHYPGGE
jgi:hypothetical protein